MTICASVSVGAFPYKIYLSSIVRSGIHKFAVGNVIFSSPQKLSGFQDMNWFHQCYTGWCEREEKDTSREKQKERIKRNDYNTFEFQQWKIVYFQENTHILNPHVRNKALVSFPLWAKKTNILLVQPGFKVDFPHVGKEGWASPQK